MITVRGTGEVDSYNYDWTKENSACRFVMVVATLVVLVLIKCNVGDCPGWIIEYLQFFWPVQRIDMIPVKSKHMVIIIFRQAFTWTWLWLRIFRMFAKAQQETILMRAITTHAYSPIPSCFPSYWSSVMVDSNVVILYVIKAGQQQNERTMFLDRVKLMMNFNTINIISIKISLYFRAQNPAKT